MAPRSLLALCGGLVLLGSYHSAPETLRYRVDTSVDQVIDLSAVGQPEQHNSMKSSYFLTLVQEDTTGGKAITITIDSITFDTATPPPPPAKAALDSAWGAGWHGLLTPDGKTTGLTAVGDSNAPDQLQQMVANFLPRVKAGAKPGDTWTDTTDHTFQDENSSIAVRTITNFSASGREAVQGVQALKVLTASSQAYNGELQGGLTMTGTGQATATYYLSGDGKYLGGESSGTADLQLSSPQLPQNIPMKTTTSSTVTLLK